MAVKPVLKFALKGQLLFLKCKFSDRPPARVKPILTWMGLTRFSLPGERVHKPGVKQSVLFFTVPFLWSTVGTVLIIRGMCWLEPEKMTFLLLPSLGLGLLKSLFILDKSIKSSLVRIAALKNGTGPGAICSWQKWLLVCVMMLGGYVLRHAGFPGNSVGVIYSAIGWAMLISSRHGWMTWYRNVYHLK